MIFYCITASITPQVMDKIILKAPQYTLQIRRKQIQDGVLLLKVLIDSYYASTRTTTINLRRQLSNLLYYMKSIAKGFRPRRIRSCGWKDLWSSFPT